MKVDSLATLGLHQPHMVCELCAGAQQPVPATYHPNNHNHPNFSWNNNQNAMQQPYQQQGARPFNPSGFEQQYAPRQQYQPPGFQQTQGGAGQSSNEKSELEEFRLSVKANWCRSKLWRIR